MQITGYKKKHEYTNKNGITSTVYLMDCMEGMAQFPDKYFDLACVDPPYGININMNMGRKKGKAKKHVDKSWDGSTPDTYYFDKLFSVSINSIIWGGNYFDLPPNRHFIFWDKLVPTELSFSDGEYAWTSFDRAIRKFTLRHMGIEEKLHPTQKPVALYDWIFHNYAEPNQKIIDTHLGSGSSRIAADKDNLHFTGFEIDEEYFDASVKRFENYASQLTLF